MTDHDPLCDWYGAFYPEGVDPQVCPDCAVIDKARADERERIASAIEDLGNSHSDKHDSVFFDALYDAARVARGES